MHFYKKHNPQIKISAGIKKFRFLATNFVSVNQIVGSPDYPRTEEKLLRIKEKTSAFFEDLSQMKPENATVYMVRDYINNNYKQKGNLNYVCYKSR